VKVTGGTWQPPRSYNVKPEDCLAHAYETLLEAKRDERIAIAALTWAVIGLLAHTLETKED
jgi:hypothetical protein